MEQWSQSLERHGAPLDHVWFCTGEKDKKSFCEFRHDLPEKVNEIVWKNKMPKTGTDIAVPDAAFPEMLRIYYEKLEASGIHHLVFGHIGECHMHANLLPVTESEYARSKAVYLELVREALRLGGTVSAEHGIGKLKHAFLQEMVGRKGMEEMARLKRTLDPACILGRDNLFPQELL